MEYQIFIRVKVDDERERFQLSQRGPEFINNFNQSRAEVSQVVLMPEFGGWMIEAVPTEPYDSLIDSEIILSCENKLNLRRYILENFLRPHNISIVSLTNCMHLGTQNGIYIDDDTIR